MTSVRRRCWTKDVRELAFEHLSRSAWCGIALSENKRKKYNRTLGPVDNLLHGRLEPTTTFFNCRLKEKDVMDWLVSSRRPVSLIFVAFLFIAASTKAQLNSNEDEATQFLKDLDPIYLREANAQMVTRWQSITDITTEHSQEEVSPFQLLCIHSLKLKRRMLFWIILTLLAVAISSLSSYLCYISSNLWSCCPWLVVLYLCDHLCPTVLQLFLSNNLTFFETLTDCSQRQISRLSKRGLDECDQVWLFWIQRSRR